MIEAGSPAPDFELPADDGTAVSLSGLRGQPVVLFFYPRDDTPGCTRQACGIRDAYDELQERRAVVLGVSPDDEASHRRFREKHGLPFTLLSDADHTVAEAYDVWRRRSLYGKLFWGVYRSTFVIDPDGKVAAALYGVKPDEHAGRVLAALDAVAQEV